MKTESLPSSGNLNEPETIPTSATTGEAGPTTTSRRGRPSGCTPEMEAAIFECLQLGMSIAQTCDCCGVTEKTFRNWRKRSSAFAAMVRRAEAEAVKANLAVIRKSATNGQSWRAAAWWLTHRHPVQWGRTETVTIKERRQEDDRESGRKFTPAQRSAKLREIFGMLGDEPKPARKKQVPSPEPNPEPAGLPDSSTNGKDDRVVESEPSQTVSAPPSPGVEERQACPTPPFRQIPTVFISGLKSGQSAVFIEADHSTRTQDGYRLMEIKFTLEERTHRLKVFGCVLTHIPYLGLEASRLLCAAGTDGSHPIVKALIAQGDPYFSGPHGATPPFLSASTGKNSRN